MKLGYPMQTAIQMTVDKYKSTIPQVSALEKAASTKSSLTNAKTQAEIDKLKSEAAENLANIDKMKADTARAGAAANAA
jgi:RPA family protein